MSSEEKRAVAVKFLNSIASASGYDESLAADDFTYWAYGVGTIDGATLKELVGNMKQIIPTEPIYHISTVTAEGERVVIEAEGDCKLADGTPYQNIYVFIATFRDGKVCAFKEYFDSRYAAECIGPVLKTLPRAADAKGMDS